MRSIKFLKSVVASSLRAVRKYNGYTQESFASNFQIKVKELQAYENGQLEIPFTLIHLICKVHEIPIHEFSEGKMHLCKGNGSGAIEISDRYSRFARSTTRTVIPILKVYRMACYYRYGCHYKARNKTFELFKMLGIDPDCLSIIDFPYSRHLAQDITFYAYDLIRDDFKFKQILEMAASDWGDINFHEDRIKSEFVKGRVKMIETLFSGELRAYERNLEYKAFVNDNQYQVVSNPSDEAIEIMKDNANMTPYLDYYVVSCIGKMGGATSWNYSGQNGKLESVFTV